MKWLFILFSIFKPFLSNGTHEMPNPVEELKEMLRVNAVKVLLAFAVFSAMATIFAAGIVMIAVDLSFQYKSMQYVQFSPTTLAGLVLILLPIIIAAIMVKKYDQTTEIKKQIPHASIGTVHPLQDALALLVHDFVKEREMKRSQEDRNPRVTELRPEHRHTHHDSSTPDNRIHTDDDLRH